MSGDYFNATDVRDGNMVLIINDILAKQLAPNGSAIGLKVNLRGEVDQQGANATRIVTGVVKAINIPGATPNSPQAYRPIWAASGKMLIRVKPNLTLTRAQVVTAIKASTSQLSLFKYQPLAQTRTAILFSQYATAITTAVLTMLTIVLAVIGLYGILSYSIVIRRFEIGTRLAIGAKRQDIVMLILKDNALAILSGITISILVVISLYLSFSDNLNDYIGLQLIPMFGGTILLVSLISLFACYWPLRPFINRPAVYSLRASD